jgi:hypothetical protein
VNEISCSDVLDVLFSGLKISPVVWSSFIVRKMRVFSAAKFLIQTPDRDPEGSVLEIASLCGIVP